MSDRYCVTLWIRHPDETAGWDDVERGLRELASEHGWEVDTVSIAMRSTPAARAPSPSAERRRRERPPHEAWGDSRL
jgi:hypothetical protein